MMRSGQRLVHGRNRTRSGVDTQPIPHNLHERGRKTLRESWKRRKPNKILLMHGRSRKPRNERNGKKRFRREAHSSMNYIVESKSISKKDATQGGSRGIP